MQKKIGHNSKHNFGIMGNNTYAGVVKNLHRTVRAFGGNGGKYGRIKM